MAKKKLLKIINMVKVFIAISIILLWFVIPSCNRIKQSNHIDYFHKEAIEWFLTEQVLGFWDSYYRFPKSYSEARDSMAWYFLQYSSIDSLLLTKSPYLKYLSTEDSLIITLNNDTLAKVKVSCLCNGGDNFPFGPRAFDTLGNLVNTGFIQLGGDTEMDSLSYEILHVLFPSIKNKMNELGYTSISKSNERQYPQYLLVSFLSQDGSVQLIQECRQYSNLLDTNYQVVLYQVLKEYCKNHHFSKLLIPVEIYLTENNNSKKF